MGYKVKYKGDVGTEGPSPALWGDCPWLEALEDPGIGFGYWNDFLAGDTYTGGTSSADAFNDWAIAETGTGTLTILPDELGGVLEIKPGATADNETTMTLGGGAPFLISDTAGVDTDLWFEVRCKTSAVADADGQFFVGLAQAGRATADGGLITDAAAVASVSLIGFVRLDSNGDDVLFVYNDSGDAATTVLTKSALLTADTFVKLGFRYQPSAPAAKRIACFVNGVEQTTYVTATNIAAATFPDGDPLTIAMGAKGDSTGQVTCEVDWVRAFQIRS